MTWNTGSDLQVPAGPVESCPVGFAPAEVQRALVLKALEGAGVELGAYDARIVEWLATWDWSTVVVIVGWLHRAQGGGAR